MPQPSKIPLAFAASGDKNVIPESTETTGLASWRDGFPAITSTPFSEGGIAPKRADFNGIFNALSQAVMWLQQGGVYAYDVNTDYEAGNVVLDVGGLYVANAANGPSSSVVQPSTDTTGATWKLVRLDLATQSAAGYMSAADKTKLDGIDLTPYALLDSPVFTGTPTAPTPVNNDSSTKLATTEFVNKRLPYSQGGWTPQLVGSTNGAEFNYTLNSGYYIKIGSLVRITAYITISTTLPSNLPQGSLRVLGLPFRPAEPKGQSIGINVIAVGGEGESARIIINGIASSNNYIVLQGIRQSNAHIGIVDISYTSSQDLNFRPSTTNEASFVISGVYHTND